MTFAFLVCTASYGAIITTPVGLAPGTQYQLAFVTADQFFATSTDISTYNTEVMNEALLSPSLAAFDAANDVTWTVIGSTTSVNANVNAPSSGLVYGLNGIQLASSTNSLYSGSLLSTLNVDQNGNSYQGLFVWTGSTTAGTAAGGINDLGQTFTEYGISSLNSGSWITAANGIEFNNFLSLYALSSIMTVPSPSAAPEPGTMVLIPGAVLFLLGIKRLGRRAKES